VLSIASPYPFGGDLSALLFAVHTSRYRQPNVPVHILPSQCIRARRQLHSCQMRHPYYPMVPHSLSAAVRAAAARRNASPPTPVSWTSTANHIRE